MRCSPLLSVLVMGWMGLSTCGAGAQARASEGTLTLPTYEEGPPNPNPPFDAYATNKFNYPYVIRDHTTDHRVTRAFRSVTLENEYLKCVVLPDVGGHVYTCTDKINNVPMFYANPSIKEAQIGMRGGWAAFGEEFNFPVSHNWMSVSPVQFGFGQDGDGSAWVTVGNTDRVYGMEWTVKMVLRPGSTVLEEQVELSNRSDLRHRFYWWSNTGVQVWDDSRICYPMRFTAAHGFADIDRWPVDRTGKDMSLMKNQTFGPVSRFVYGSREPFMGIWNPKTDAGVAHFASYDELPGKKIWSWGADADGLDWRKVLSDNDSQYVEVQGGLFRNQETYAFLPPRGTIRFREFWMPLRSLGGLARANLAGAVNLTRTGSDLRVALNVNQKMAGVTVRLLDGAKVVSSVKLDLTPARTWTKEIAGAGKAYTFELADGSGAVVLRQTEGEYDWTPAAEVQVGKQVAAVMPEPGKRSGDDWLTLGRDDELNGKLLLAAAAYRDGLMRFPESQGLTIAAGRLDVQVLHEGEAVALLTRAQERDTPNPEVAYYLAAAYDAQGDAAHARLDYEASARLPQMRAAASLKLGELLARGGDLKGAAEQMAIARHEATDDVRAVEETVAVHRARGAGAGMELARDWYAQHPTSAFLAEEVGKPQIEVLAAEPERVLQVASEYMRLGMDARALTVLSREYPEVPAGTVEPGAVLPQRNPMVGYYEAFCLMRLKRPFAAELKRAAGLPLAYVFPSGAQSQQVLTWARGADRRDASAAYLLGTLQFSVGFTKDAEVSWEAAHALRPEIPVLDADMGMAALEEDHDPARAEAAFREGLRDDPANVANYVGMDEALSLLRRPPAEFIEAAGRYPDQAKMPEELVYELALHYVEEGEFEAAEALFRDRFFPKAEGGTNVRLIWIEVELARLHAEADAGRCEVAAKGLSELTKPREGMEFTRDGLEEVLASGRNQFRVGRIDDKCGRAGEAKAAFARAAAGGDVVWARRSAERLPGFEAAAWESRIAAAIDGLSARVEAGGASATVRYGRGLLEQEAGLKAAAADFKEALLLPDQQMAYHLTRVAMESGR